MGRPRRGMARRHLGAGSREKARAGVSSRTGSEEPGLARIKDSPKQSQPGKSAPNVARVPREKQHRLFPRSHNQGRFPPSHSHSWVSRPPWPRAVQNRVRATRSARSSSALASACHGDDLGASACDVEGQSGRRRARAGRIRGHGRLVDRAALRGRLGHALPQRVLLRRSARPSRPREPPRRLGGAHDLLAPAWCRPTPRKGREAIS